jgi:putative ABC transport system substrate-binding protein
MRKLLLAILIVFVCFVYGTNAGAKSIDTIGVVYSADIKHYGMIHKSVLKNLKAMGVDLSAIRFIEQKPYPDVISWANSVRKLVAYDADLIITYGSGATYEALNETGSIPVVYGAVFGKPPEIIRKKNCCGASYMISMHSFMRYLKHAKDVSKLAIVYSPFEVDSVVQFESMKKLCHDLSVSVQGISIKNKSDLETKLTLNDYDALFVTGCALANFEFKMISDIAMKKGVPVLSLYEGTEKYALLTMTADVERQGKEIANMVFDLIKDGKKHHMEHHTVTKTRIYFNLKKTNELGLKIPVRLVTTADKVIR